MRSHRSTLLVTVLIGAMSALSCAQVFSMNASAAPSAGVGSHASKLTISFDSSPDYLTVIINGQLQWTYGCNLFYDPAHGHLYLLNDDSSSWGTGAKIWSSTALENSQCVVTGGGDPGLQQQFSVAIVFKTPAFAGVKTIYVRGHSPTSGISNWLTVGTWNIVPELAADVYPRQASSGTDGYTLASGPDFAPTFLFHYLDTFGAGDIRYVVNVLSLGTFSYANGCVTFYDPEHNQIYLLNDDASAWSPPQVLGWPGTLQNSLCTIDVEQSLASASGTDLYLSLAVLFHSSAISSTQGMGLWAWSQSKYDESRNVRNAPSSAPIGGWWVSEASMGPNSHTPGSNGEHNFTLRYFSIEGATSIQYVHAVIDGISGVYGQNSCANLYDPLQNQIYLLNDSASSWGTPHTLGSPGFLQNSYCTVNVGSSSASTAGRELDLNLVITPRDGLANVASTSAFIDGKFGVHDSLTHDFRQIGWSATLAPISSVPISGTGSTQTFTVRFYDALGFDDISSATVVVSAAAALVGGNGCSVTYTKSNNSLTFDSSGAVAALGMPGTLGNSVCAVDVGGASVTGSGNYLDLTLPFTFKAGAIGNNNIFAYATGTSGAQDKGQRVAQWRTTRLLPADVTPATGSGTQQVFEFHTNDANGIDDLSYVVSVINTDLTFAGACSFLYYPAPNKIFLLNDAGDSWGTAMSVGNPGTLQNSQCALDVGASSVVADLGGDLALHLDVTFSSAFSGTRNVYTHTYTKSGVGTGWSRQGNWTIP